MHNERDVHTRRKLMLIEYHSPICPRAIHVDSLAYSAHWPSTSSLQLRHNLHDSPLLPGKLSPRDPENARHNKEAIVIVHLERLGAQVIDYKRTHTPSTLTCRHSRVNNDRSGEKHNTRPPTQLQNYVIASPTLFLFETSIETATVYSRKMFQNISPAALTRCSSDSGEWR